jgi:hypothetical protein
MCPSCGHITKCCSECGSKLYDMIQTNETLIPVPQNRETLQQVNLVLLNAAAQREEQLLELIRTMWKGYNENNLDTELSDLQRNIINLAMRT